MGAHARISGQHAKTTGRHRGEAAPLVDLDISKWGATAGAFAAVAGTAVALAPAAGAAPAAPRTASVHTASADDFARLRMCESGGNYAINTGNGYYGGYQFDLQTWHGLGYGGLPSGAAPAVQDQAAVRLQAARGWSPWPACSAKLGLGADGSSVQVPTGSTIAGSVGSGYNPLATSHDSWTARAVRAGARSEDASAHVTVAPATPPTFDPQNLPNQQFDQSLVTTKRADVQQWQQRMHDRGWPIMVDGYFGPQSAGIATAFAREKGIASGVLGTVDQAMWNAAWQLPVT